MMDTLSEVYAIFMRWNKKLVCQSLYPKIAIFVSSGFNFNQPHQKEYTTLTTALPVQFLLSQSQYKCSKALFPHLH